MEMANVHKQLNSVSHYIHAILTSIQKPSLDVKMVLADKSKVTVHKILLFVLRIFHLCVSMECVLNHHNIA